VRSRLIIFWCCAAVVLGCSGSPGSQTTNRGSPSSAASGAPKRISVVVIGAPSVLYNKLSGRVVRGGEPLDQILNAGLLQYDANDNFRPQLARSVPTLDNGLWQLLPDGRMEITWQLSPAGRWHDGTRFTTNDVLFTWQVVHDPEAPEFADTTYDMIERVRSDEADTVTATWKQPNYRGPSLFTSELALPLPAHLLARAYADEKAAFVDQPYWSHEFIGTGPYRLRSFDPGTRLSLVANGDYVLGRPKIDEIDILFIGDSNALIAHILAGQAELLLGGGLSLEQGIDVSQQWRAGSVEFYRDNWMQVYPQLLRPSPEVVGNVQFRRAMMHAMDRQEMVETLMHGRSNVAHSMLNPESPEGRAVANRLVRYDYDPRRASDLLAGVGFTRGTDGTLRDSTNTPLGVQILASGDTQNTRPMHAVADDWKAIGVGVETLDLPRQRAQDREYRATRPSFELRSQQNQVHLITRLHSREVPLPERRYVGINYSRYASAEMDAQVEGFFAAIRPEERMQILGDIMHEVTSEVIWLGLFYRADPNLIGSRIKNVMVLGTWRQTWNAEQWDAS
jgi:peptide/nickel transport system substrate-binding protein